MSGGAYLPRRRLTLLLPVVLIHVAVLAVVAMDNIITAPARPAFAPGIEVFDLPEPAAAPPPSRPAAIVKIAALAKPAPLPLAEPQAAAPASVAEVSSLAAMGCDLTDVVQAALRSDIGVRVAMAALPSDARSVANAVMLWQAHWIDGDSPATQDALTRIRSVIVATIASASDDCRTEIQAGPRLIAIAGPPDITFALGSGRWRWGDLVAPATAQIASIGGDGRPFQQTGSTQGE